MILREETWFLFGSWKIDFGDRELIKGKILMGKLRRNRLRKSSVTKAVNLCLSTAKLAAVIWRSWIMQCCLQK